MPVDQIWILSVLEDKPYRDVKKLWKVFETEYDSVGVQIFSHPHVTFQGGKTADLRQLKRDFQETISKIRPFEIEVNGPRHFDDKVIYLEVEKTQRLIELNKRINQFLKIHCHNLLEDYAPGSWIPHITLAMDDLSKRNFEKARAELKDSRIQFRQRLHNICIVQRYPDGKIRIGKRYELQAAGRRRSAKRQATR
jgi:2'-5' RNA ligase